MRSQRGKKGEPPLGGLELEVLQFVSENPPKTVREVVAQYGEPRGLARTTILTVMERLRAKGYLEREQVDGSFTYSPGKEQAEVMEGIVQTFVERTLGGSLQPFIAYLANSRGLSEAEISQLNELVDKMETGKEGSDA
jgi:predicted transcriptional regulator